MVGADVVVTGTVSEFVPAADSYGPPLTELTGSSIVAVLHAGVTLPTPVVLTTPTPRRPAPSSSSRSTRACWWKSPP